MPEAGDVDLEYRLSRTELEQTVSSKVNQGISRSVQQRTNALALSLRHRLSNDLLMEFTGGLASRDNADFVSGASKKNKFVGWSISQRF